MISSRFLCLLGFFALPAVAPAAGAQQPHGTGGIDSPAQRTRPYVVLVSFDGFRADFLARSDVPNFRRVIDSGVRAEYLLSAFPSKTFPNHYTLATGLYPEHHGIVANAFYDPVRQATFRRADPRDVQDGSWFRGEPIWVTAERQGMVAAAFFWPGSEAVIEGVRPTHWKPFGTVAPDSARVDSIAAWLRLPAADRPHLLTLYLEDVDSAEHQVGPFAPPVDTAIARVDRTLGRLLDSLGAMPADVRRSLSLVLVSDHGMARYGPADYVPIESLVDTAAVRIGDVGAVANLFAPGGPAAAVRVRDSINAILRHGHAYLRQEVPAHFHYRADPRIGDVVVIMDLPFLVGHARLAPTHVAGQHGWDPAEPAMHGIFVAMGPGLRRGATIAAFENVDVEPFLVERLGLKQPEPVDGKPGRLLAAARERGR